MTTNLTKANILKSLEGSEYGHTVVTLTAALEWIGIYANGRTIRTALAELRSEGKARRTVGNLGLRHFAI